MSKLHAILSDELLEKEDTNYPPVILFSCDTFIFSPEQGSVNWEYLVNAVKCGLYYKLDWSPSNGECFIEVKDNMVCFAVSKYGDGRGGFLSTGLSAKYCLEAFEKADKITKQWMNKK